MYLFVYGFNISFSGKPERMEISESPDVDKDLDVGMAIKVGSMVKVHLAKGPVFGTVRWIGYLRDRTDEMAGLELVLVNTDPFW